MAKTAVPLLAVFERLFETFGPFLIPATLFALGLIGYLLLYAIERSRTDDWFVEEE
ncbi:MAG: hypothetical protein ACQET5_02910 [Halobacteriota archaeon]|uniref:hypothetical protein n=1 Tax=Natronomonas sp. TaxID=2184060 RepID=UPI0039757B01